MARRPRRSDRPVSLWTRVVAVISAVLVAGTIITGALSLYLLNRTLLSSVDEDLHDAQAQVVSQGPDAVAAEGVDGVDGGSFAPVDFVVEYRDDAGETLRRVEQNHGAGDPALDFPELTSSQIRALDGEPFTLLDAHQQRWRVLAVPDPASGGSVYIALPLQNVDTTMHEMALIIVLVGTAVVLGGMSIGGYVAHRALEPLRDVEATAREIVGGELSRRVPVSSTSQEVHDLAARALDNTRTMGVALTPCIVPKVGTPTFEIPEGKIEVGMGIHGEAGIEVRDIMTADEVAETILTTIEADMPLASGDEVSVMVNGLGGTPLEEQYIVFRAVHAALADKGVTIVMPHIGEFATSMEMAGLSVTVCKLDAELKELLLAPAKTPFYTNLNK